MGLAVVWRLNLCSFVNITCVGFLLPLTHLIIWLPYTVVLSTIWLQSHITRYWLTQVDREEGTGRAGAQVFQLQFSESGGKSSWMANKKERICQRSQVCRNTSHERSASKPNSLRNTYLLPHKVEKTRSWWRNDITGLVLNLLGLSPASLSSFNLLILTQCWGSNSLSSTKSHCHMAWEKNGHFLLKSSH